MASVFSSFLDEESKHSLQSVLQIGKKFLRFVLLFIWIPILIAIGIGYYFFQKEQKKEITYTAELSFIDEAQLGASIPNLANYGLGGLGAAGGNSGGDVLSGIIFSDAIISKALLSSVSATNTQSLINYYLRVYWDGKSEQNFVTGTSLDSLSMDDKQTYIRVYNRITHPENGLMKFTSSEVKRLSVTSLDEDLSVELIDNVYSALLDFYSSTSTESYDSTLDVLEFKRDSVYNALKRMEGQLAITAESSGFRKLPTQQLTDRDLQRKIGLAQTQYSNLYLQVETFKLQNNKSVNSKFRELNIPIRPLKTSKINPVKQGIIGALIGFFAGLFFVLFLFFFIEIIKLLKNL